MSRIVTYSKSGLKVRLSQAYRLLLELSCLRHRPSLYHPPLPAEVSGYKLDFGK